MAEHRIDGPAIVFVLPLEGMPYLTVAGVEIEQLDASLNRIAVDLYSRSVRLGAAFLELSAAIDEAIEVRA